MADNEIFRRREKADAPKAKRGKVCGNAREIAIVNIGHSVSARVSVRTTRTSYNEIGIPESGGPSKSLSKALSSAERHRSDKGKKKQRVLSVQYR